MPIPLTCACGRSFQVPEVHAGKKGKCPGCAALILIPAPPPPEPEMLEPLAEVVEDDVVEADADDEVIDAEDELVEVEAVEDRPKKKKKKRRGDKEGELTRMYMNQAQEQMRRDAARTYGGKGGGGGWTFWGIHITAGVIGGVGMVISGVIGLLAVWFATLFFDLVNPLWAGRGIGTSVAAIGLGLIVLIRALVFGQED